MNHSDKTELDDHPQDMLLAYLEGALSGEKTAMLETHINICDQCSAELNSVGTLLEILKTERDIFCPEPWELYEFIESGNDPEGRLAEHLEKCPLCRSDVADYGEAAMQKSLPSAIKNELKKVFPKPARRGISKASNGFTWAKDWLSSIFKIPALALGTALAAILSVILLYPHGTVPTFIGVSSDNWEETSLQATPKSLFLEAPERKEIANPLLSVDGGASKPILFEAPKPRLAPVIIFHGFDKPLSQSTIDSLYEGLSPTAELKKRFEFSAPAQLKEFLDKIADRKLTYGQALAEFYKRNSITYALITNIKNEKGVFGFKSQVVNTHNGKILAELSHEGLSGSELATRVNGSLELLNEVKTENRAK